MSQTVAYQEGKHNKISAIVDHVMFIKGLPDQWFQFFLEAGLWELRELKLDVWQDVKTELFEVSDRKTVILPPGFVDWTVVAKKVGQYFVAMSVNDKLNLLPRDNNSSDFVAGLLSQNLPNGISAGNYTGYGLSNYNGGTLQCFDGRSFFTKGSFRVQQTGLVKELILDYDYPADHVYIEYITDGFDPCGETVVDPYFADYVKKAMEFVYEENREPNRTESSIRRRGRSLADAKRKCIGRKNDLDPKTMLDLSRASFRLTTKA
jgi:hypothetical protein